MNYLMGLDIGTSSVKGVLMSTAGAVVAKAHESFKYTKLENGKVELAADDFLTANLLAIKTLASSAKDGEILGICASSASGNLLLVDQAGKPLTSIISWQDKRVENEAREVLGEMEPNELYRKIGWPFGFKTFPLAQLCYIKKHTPKLLKECGKVCMSTEYLYYVLTGKWGISPSAGTPFFMIDQKNGTYITELLEKLELDEDQLPPILPCGTILGSITEEASKLCGLKSGTPVILGSFDHPSAARGAGVLKEGEMLLSCGTSWVAFLPVASREKIAKAKTLIDPFLSPKGCWATMASVPSVSARIRLYTERYIDNTERAFETLAQLARESSAGAGGLSIDLREEPEDDRICSYAKEQIARAIMEGTVRLLKEKIDGLKEAGITANSAVMVGGPSEERLWIEIIEEVCGISVRVVHGAVAGAIGAAVLAGMGTGVFRDEFHAQELLSEL